MRFHMLQNAQMALDFLRYKKIKLVNIRAEDIVDGNPKLTLGLIWTIILHFQVSILFIILLLNLMLHLCVSQCRDNAERNVAVASGYHAKKCKTFVGTH